MYALGIIWYCIATGEHPFDADSYDKILEKNLLGKFDKKLLINLQTWEQKAIIGLLEKDPIDRLYPETVLAMIFEEKKSKIAETFKLACPTLGSLSTNITDSQLHIEEISPF